MSVWALHRESRAYLDVTRHTRDGLIEAVSGFLRAATRLLTPRLTLALTPSPSVLTVVSFVLSSRSTVCMYGLLAHWSAATGGGIIWGWGEWGWGGGGHSLG